MAQVQPLPSTLLELLPVLQESPVPLVLSHSCLGTVEVKMRPHKLSRGVGVCTGGKRVFAPPLTSVLPGAMVGLVVVAQILPDCPSPSQPHKGKGSLYQMLQATLQCAIKIPGGGNLVSASCAFSMDNLNGNGLRFPHRLIFSFFCLLDMISGKKEFLAFAFSLPSSLCLTLFASVMKMGCETASQRFLSCFWKHVRLIIPFCSCGWMIIFPSLFWCDFY